MENTYPGAAVFPVFQDGKPVIQRDFLIRVRLDDANRALGEPVGVGQCVQGQGRDILFIGGVQEGGECRGRTDVPVSDNRL